jgi:murein tripeptide amidase MpaA
MRALLLLVAFLWAGSLCAQNSAETIILPPALDWEGRSLELVTDADDPWITPAEASGFETTPRYAETVDWIRRLADVSPDLSLVSLGKSAEQRDIWMVVAARDGVVLPDVMAATGKPTLLAHAGIHSGEIDGKDAGLMLLRDLTLGGRLSGLLNEVNLLFVPILNVDGHERFGAFSRFNQRGPREAGWRTNGRNLNLNRDFAKLESEEIRALVLAMNRWRPDLYMDLHVTDGADYQYDITYGFNGRHAWSPSVGAWLEDVYRPFVDEFLEDWGHVPGPLVFGANGRDLTGGIFEWTAGPRFSQGYGDLRHVPSVLVENHSLKPYRQRVLGTYVLLEASLKALATHGASARAAMFTDQSERPDHVPLDWRVPASVAAFLGQTADTSGATPPETITVKGVRSVTEPSSVSGAEQVRWLGEPIVQTVPIFRSNEPAINVQRPVRYYIPAAWSDIAERLKLHGVAMDRIDTARTVSVTMMRLPAATLSTRAFEGRIRVAPGAVQTELHERVFAPGSFAVATDQALGDLVVVLLDPRAPDSFFQWGYFHEILQRTEYFEDYVMEPMAQRMLEEDPELRRDFDQMLSDPEFASNPRRRLEWFYERTPYSDPELRLYPIGWE